MTIREQKILVSFVSDAEVAMAVAEHVRIAVTALVLPTRESASELFRIGCEAVVIAAEIEREAGAA